MSKTFLIMAGGTGGHVYPALATARELQVRGDQVAWLGSIGGMEERIANEAGIPFYGIKVSGLRGKGWATLVAAPLKLAIALGQALAVVRKVKPNCVLGMGGFASGPGGLMAKLSGCRLIIHEQNSIAGMTNRLLSTLADSVLIAFPSAFHDVPKRKLTGNPLRSEICEIFYRPRPIEYKGRTLRILVLGGSLGAAALNETIPKALALIDEVDRPEVKHQSGRGKGDVTYAQYQQVGVNAEVVEFVDNMKEAYVWADFVICRAGALTISELCVAGLGSILVPYPHAVDDHQTLNAVSMEEAGAAWLLPQTKMTPNSLAEMLVPLLAKPERVGRLAEAARALAKPDAAERVALECRRLTYV
jgi:UDP-N-acetylglucosamine--N-acetylmuramyl-(pentapeptide) pyrophosphoryl-undecaprenol N-acetylglucosamine transferase